MALHWLVAMLVLAAAGLALFREAFGSVSIAMISAHKQVGLAILALALARLAWRLRHRLPPHGPNIPRWESRVANTAHRILYFLLIAVPVTGWLFVSYTPPSRPLDYRGSDSIPKLPLGESDAASFAWHEAHELMGFGLIALVLIHIAAVVRHQWILRDGLLSRMAGPGWPLALAWLTLVVLALWLVGLSLDMFDVRLMGDSSPRLLEPVALKD